MFLAFNLEKLNDYSAFYHHGQQHLKNNHQKVSKTLKDYLLSKNGALSGLEIEKEWFPQINIDIFLSHSHKDQKSVISFAGWLNKTFNLNVFVDSGLWGNSAELLKEIDDEYCKNENKLSYSYEKRNYSTSHVHMMLAMSLAKVMDKAEITLFLNTDNTIKPVSDTINKSTSSPWIYTELVFTSLIQKKVPRRELLKSIDEDIMFENRNLEIEHNVQEYINKLVPLTEDNLKLWEKKYNEASGSKEHPLDYLYVQIKNIDELSKN